MTQTHKQNVPKLRFPGFEGEWKSTTLGSLMEIKSASRVHKDEWREDGVPFFRSSDVVSSFKGNENKKAFISNALFEKLAAKSGKVKKGDILVTGGGSIGIPYLIQSDVPLYFKDADLLWFRNSGTIEGFYLYTFFIAPIFRRYVQSITHIGTISHYTIEQARVTPINLPALPEQRKIAGFLSAVDTKIAHLSRKKSLLEDYKKGCMQQLFSQKIRFKDDDGSDSPEWEEKRLGDVVTILSGYAFKSDDFQENGRHKIIRMSDLKSGSISKKDHALVTDKAVTGLDRFQLKTGDFLFGMSGSLSNYAWVREEDGSVFLNQRVGCLRSMGNNIGLFIHYLYLSKPIQNKIEASAAGAAQLNISTRFLQNLKIKIPHPAEQRKIADFLSALDRKIDLVAQELTHARSFKAGLLQQMFV